MIPIKTNELASITLGKNLCLGKGDKITGVAIDSKEVKDGFLFVPLKGSRVDGHDYIEDAISRGAVAILTERDYSYNQDVTVVKVVNSLKALHKLTKYYRRLVKIPIIALTGSSGKTTTKDLIYYVLKQKFRVHKTKGNQNNHLGVPLTIFGIEKDTEIAVVEMGMNHLGEIRTLVNMVYPDISVITNIGVTHMEYLNTQENIFKAKTEILETLREDQYALVNGDDKYLSTVKSDTFKVISFGREREKVDFRGEVIESTSSGLKFIVYSGEEREVYRFTFPGIHNMYNCLVAISLGHHFGLSQDEIQAGLDEYQPSNLRMDIRHIEGVTIINDSYNANPEAVRAAINVLIDYKGKEGRAIAVLGDMLEMGQESDRYHYELGQYLARSKEVDYLICIGRYAGHYGVGAMSEGMAKDRIHHFTDNTCAGKYIKDIMQEKDVILIKGSRAMSMEKLLDILERS